MTRPSPIASLCIAALVAGCATPQARRPGTSSTAEPEPAPAPPPSAASAGPAPGGPTSSQPHVSSTILPGVGGYASLGAPAPPPAPVARPGPVSLNFPSVDVTAFAKAVLGDVLGLPYGVDPSVHGVVTLVTPRPIAKADVLPLVEDALKSSSLALELRGGIYTIVPLSTAQASAPVVGPQQPGYGDETITLHYANPVELKKIIDPIVPGVITAADPATGTMVLSGSSGQRRAVRDLVSQFDIDWLKGMSFALFVPKNTDARLIAPELDRLINAPGAPTAGLVRLLAMDKLNGIIAIAPRAQYLDDVRHWVEVLDREGESSERRLYVYRVQNGRAADLANVLISAFGGTPASSGAQSGRAPFGSSPASGAGFGSSGTGGVASLGASNAGSPSSIGMGGSLFGAGAATPNGTPIGGSLLAATSPGAGQSLPGQSPTASTPVAKPGGGESLVITADETNNAVVAFATPREYALIEDALRRLDVAPLQVVIEAAITEVTLNDALQYGAQWYFNTHGNQYALTQSTTAITPVATPPGFVYSLMPGSTITATINALSTVTHVQVLSAPNLLVLNNQTASLQVGDEVPISTGSALSTVGAETSIQYQPTGVILQLTPRVNSSGLVLLDISQEVSQVNTSSTSTSANPIASPVISERKVATSVAVQDGQTIALGGLIQDDISKTRSGIPVLSAIPILGALVGNRNNSRTRTELLVLLTPKVIRNAEDSRAVTEELREKIKSIAPQRPGFEP